MATLHAGSQFHGYNVWTILESRPCTKPHKTLDSKAIASVGMGQIKSKRLVGPTAENFIKRLYLCIASNDVHFETN
ncbi:hypothetical protein TNCV_1606831 [Trichonephila clavipes]|nr:hypothetical protein TNCV_1606831 [Trichonephila clavipes]